MKPTLHGLFIALALIAGVHQAAAQGTTFTYQGRLQNSGSPVTGLYDFQFALSNAPSGGSKIGVTVTNLGVGVTNGLFTTTLNFGAVFNGQATWLAISVRTNGAGSYVGLTPLQPLTPTPYAIYAEAANAANLAGTIASANLPDGLGGSGNTAGGGDSTVAGGSSNTANGGGSTVGGGEFNNAGGNLATVAGGAGNNAGGNFSFAAGHNAQATNDGSFVWADSQFGNFYSTTNDSFNVRAQGGARFVTSGKGMSVDGTVSAANFSGNGSGLTNLTASAAQLTSIGNTGGGSDNFFVGPAGNPATTGSQNTADGVNALVTDTGGGANTAIGYSAMRFNSTGSGNTAVGDGALFYGGGNFNTAVGDGALFNGTLGSNNIALGWQAGQNLGNGSSNIDIGNFGVSTDVNVIRIGSGQTNTFIAGVINGNGGGLTNLPVSAAQLTSIGNGSGGSGNFFIGTSGNSTTTGNFNTADGVTALVSDTTGSENNALGDDALFKNTSGNDNTAIGQSSLQFSTTASRNTAIGAYALFSNSTGSNNIALGYLAGQNLTTGSSNIDIGNFGVSSDANIIRIGSSQTSTFLAGNVSIGTNAPVAALDVAGSGWFRTNANGLASSAGRGVRVFVDAPTNGSIFAYDYGASVPLNLILQQPGGFVGIGTTTPDALLSVNGTADKPGGGSWGTFSDARLKDVGADFTHGLSALDNIQPVHYHYKSDNPLNLPSQPEYVGVVAQQVEKAIPEAVQRNKDGYLVVNNDPIIWTMFNAVKELNQKVEEKDARIKELEARLEKLEQMMNAKIGEAK